MKGATSTTVSSRANCSSPLKGQRGDPPSPSKESRPYVSLSDSVLKSLATPLRLWRPASTPRRQLRPKNSNIHSNGHSVLRIRDHVGRLRLLVALFLVCALLWCYYVGSHVAIQIHWVDEDGGARSAIEFFSYNQHRLSGTSHSKPLLHMEDTGPPPFRALQEQHRWKQGLQTLNQKLSTQLKSEPELQNGKQRQNHVAEDATSDKRTSVSSRQSLSSQQKQKSSQKSGNDSSNRPPYAVSEQMRRQACTIKAQSGIKEMQEVWRKRVVPLLTSAILSPPQKAVSDKPEEWKMHIFFNIRYMKKHKKDFFLKRDRMDWYCDNQLGHIVGSQPGDPEGVTVILVCPQRPSDDESTLVKRVHLQSYGDKRKGQGNSRTRRIQTYDVSDLTQCAWEERNSEYVPTTASGETAKPKYAACPIVWGPESVPLFLQWVAYNRLIGFDHFFVYLHEPWEDSRAKVLPSAPYITYRIFDVDGVAVKRGGGSTAKNYYQPVQQTECIYKARTYAGGSIDWVAIMDIDEYFQVVVRRRPADVPPNRPVLSWILDPLEERVKAGNFAGVMVKNWFWGAPRVDGAEGEVVENPPPLVEHEFLLEYVHRAPRWTQRYREKNIVHPWNVRYYAMHTITEGVSAVVREGTNGTIVKKDQSMELPEERWHIQSGGEIKIGPHHLVLRPARQMRMSHFKEASRGVYHYKANNLQVADVKHDTTLRDDYLDDVKALVAKMEFYD